MSRWWSLAPVSITPVFWKISGLFVNIKSIHVPVDVLKHVFDLIKLINSLRREGEKLFTRQICAIFVNFYQIRKIKSLRKTHRYSIREIESSQKKEFFFSFLRIIKTYIFTLGALSVNDGHVKNILQDIKQSRIASLISK